MASFSATELGGFTIRSALERAGLSGEQVDYVLMGHVLQAGAGQITARQAAVNAGISMSVPATTVNKVCLSGMDAIYQADRDPLQRRADRRRRRHGIDDQRPVPCLLYTSDAADE